MRKHPPPARPVPGPHSRQGDRSPQQQGDFPGFGRGMNQAAKG
jgi:hypothetical protein